MFRMIVGYAMPVSDGMSVLGDDFLAIVLRVAMQRPVLGGLCEMYCSTLKPIVFFFGGLPGASEIMVGGERKWIGNAK